MRYLFALAAVVLFVWLAWETHGITQPPGVLIPEEPSQRNVSARSWDREGTHFTALAEFSGRGRVLSRTSYIDGLATIAPVDLAIGWNAMSDSSVLDGLKVHQSDRFLFVQPKAGAAPLSQETITSQSANLHIVPATAEIRASLRTVERGFLIDFAGYLVEVEGNRCGRWRSSMSRTDTGDGACELLWLESLRVSRTPDFSSAAAR